MVRKLEKLGCRASHTAELRFEACRVPADHLLGGEKQLERRLERARSGESPSATLGAFEQTRPMVAAQALGIARAALEFASEYAAERETFGSPIIEKQGVAFPLADVAAELDAARLLTWRAAWMAAQGVPSTSPKARCRSSSPPRSRCARPSRRSRPAAAGATCATFRSRSGFATRSSTRSSRDERDSAHRHRSLARRLSSRRPAPSPAADQRLTAGQPLRPRQRAAIPRRHGRSNGSRSTRPRACCVRRARCSRRLALSGDRQRGGHSPPRRFRRTSCGADVEHRRSDRRKVELRGIEPLTSRLPAGRSPS